MAERLSAVYSSPALETRDSAYDGGWMKDLGTKMKYIYIVADCQFCHAPLAIERLTEEQKAAQLTAQVTATTETLTSR
jgi:hypothetical protein